MSTPARVDGRGRSTPNVRTMIGGSAVPSRAACFAFGNVAIDDLVFADGTTMWAVPGGGAVYAALGMALWTGAAAVVAPLGPDYPRDRFPALDFLTSRTLGHTMRNWGLYEADGSRHFLSRRDSVPWDAFSSDARDLDAGPYAHAHIAPMPWARTCELIDRLRARGARTISLDLHDRELARVSFAQAVRIIARVDIFLPSRQDLDVLFARHEPLAALRALRARVPQVPILGVKCGPDGAFVHAAGSTEIVVVPSAAVELIDATGAGDAFCGGFLAGFAAAGDPVGAAACGAVSASFALASVGPAALSAADSVRARERRDALLPRITRTPLGSS